MLIDRLGSCTSQQHYILVKRIDLTNQLDAVDQKHGDWNLFLAQSGQELVL